MVEGGSLENYLGSDVYGGSNPSLSATNPEKSGFFYLSDLGRREEQ